MTSYLDITNGCACFYKLLGLKKEEVLDMNKIKYNHAYTKRLIERYSNVALGETRAYLHLIDLARYAMEHVLFRKNLPHYPLHKCEEIKKVLELIIGFKAKIIAIKEGQNNFSSVSLEDNKVTEMETSAPITQTIEITSEQVDTALEAILPSAQQEDTFKKQIKRIIKHDWVRGDMTFLVEWAGYKNLETREKVGELLKHPSKLRNYIDKKGGKTKTTFIRKHPEAASKIYTAEDKEKEEED